MSIHGLNAKEFPKLSREALKDEVQRGAISKATDTIRDRRGAAVEQIPEWEGLRERARAIKAHTLARLDHYLEEFAARAEQAGVQIHWAKDAQEAGETIAGLIPEGSDKPIVKSKSMATEEIGLNHLLEARGMRPVETDLGEWIQQMAGEPPSHIIVPAIHKTEKQIADLFAEKLGSNADASAEELTAIAREILREEFANAEVGISGVNFAVAETGSFFLLENEGNIRLTTTLPRIHIALMGIEKLLPRLSDLEVFLRLLPRSGTGQHLTSYQTLFTGNAHLKNGEGPEQMHLILLDNGRSALLGDELAQSSLQCIRCGACLNVCPVFRQIGGHAYGSVYPGPIGSVVTPQLAGIEHARALPFACSLCVACKEVCPVKIDLPEVLLDLRKQASKGAGLNERMGFGIWAWFMKSRRRYRWSLRIARLFFPLGKSVGPFKKWRAGRELPKPAAKSFGEQWTEKKEEQR
jgi:L-lactate dehydrogenase complex protein LldF